MHRGTLSYRSCGRVAPTTGCTNRSESSTSPRTGTCRPRMWQLWKHTNGDCSCGWESAQNAHAANMSACPRKAAEARWTHHLLLVLRSKLTTNGRAMKNDWLNNLAIAHRP